MCVCVCGVYVSECDCVCECVVVCVCMWMCVLGLGDTVQIIPCDYCLKPSCNYRQYCLSLLVVINLQTEVYK